MTESNMRTYNPIQRLILALSIILLCPALLVAQSNEDVLVLVNESPITRRDLQIEIGVLDAEMARRNHPLSDHEMAGLSRKLVENLVRRELLHQRAKQKKIQIQKRWVRKALAEFKAKLRTKAAYRDYLKKASLDEIQLTERIKKGLVVRRLLRRVVIRPIKVSEAEMQAFYRKFPDFFQRREQIRIRHIMVSFDEPDDISNRGETLVTIQGIHKKLLEGESFAALALEYSDDDSSTNGGDLGYLVRDQIIEPLAEAAFSLKPGQVSDIVETRLGYHLVQMVDRIPSSQLAYRNARTKIERTLRRNKENRATNRYMTRLMSQASIKRLIRP